MVITTLLLSTKDTGKWPASCCLRTGAHCTGQNGEMTNKLNKTDRRLTDLTVNLNTFNMMGTGSMANVTNTWRDWQEAQEEMIKDVQRLQEDGFIPEALHEHATWATSTIIFVILIMLIIALVCIGKAIENTLRNVTS